MTKTYTPRVSILVNTKDRRKDLALLLDSFEQLDYPGEFLEIIVMEETDDPLPIIRPHIRYYSIPRENRGFGYARNQCLKKANNEILVFTDDDCIVESDWLKALVAPLSDEKIAGVAGAVITYGNTRLGHAESILGFPSGGVRRLHNTGGKFIPSKNLVTSNCAYRRKVIEEVGGFDETLNCSGEDTVLSEKVAQNHFCVYNPHALVHHKPRGNLWRIFKWFIRRGKSDIDVMRLLGESPLPRVRRSVLIKSLFGIILLRIMGISAGWIPITIFLIYFLGVLYKIRFCYALYNDWILLILTPIVRLFMDIGTDVGRIIRLSGWDKK